MGERALRRVAVVVLCAAAIAGAAAADAATLVSGRQEGLTSQSQFMRFTITADRRYVVQLAIGAVVMNCPDGSQNGVPIEKTSRARRFKIDSKGRFTVKPAKKPRKADYVLRGRIQGRRATGSVRMVDRDSGGAVTCDSGTLSWSTKHKK
jgi:hypothetical protein